MGNGLEEKYVIKNNKKLALGYTTGSCAAAAAKAAAILLFTRQAPETVSLMTPKGILLKLHVLEAQTDGTYASCAIQKDAGDDPDVTNGVLVYAKVWKKNSTQTHNMQTHNTQMYNTQMYNTEMYNTEKGGKEQKVKVCITGGTGVGRITKPGL